MSSTSNMASRISSDFYDEIAAIKDSPSPNPSSKSSSSSSRISVAMKKAKAKLSSSSSTSPEERAQKKAAKSAKHSQAFKDTLFAYEVLAMTK
ncbi:hypothetical protein PG993_007074 [Apiospora rasikravindrae]|uniref:Uncharacterized protein n=1 Tax=Apiospora rasikravindrae TaxID=990691 RepID=A0ABR1SWI4_9PEZI